MSLRGFSKGGTGGAIATPPLFDRIEGATLLFAVLPALPTHFKKILTPLSLYIGISFLLQFVYEDEDKFWYFAVFKISNKGIGKG